EKELSRLHGATPEGFAPLAHPVSGEAAQGEPAEETRVRIPYAPLRAAWLHGNGLSTPSCVSEVPRMVAACTLEQPKQPARGHSRAPVRIFQRDQGGERERLVEADPPDLAPSRRRA